MDIRIATSDQLIDMITYAIQNDLNRQAPDLVLDPTGLHVLSFMMLHEHANGVPVKPHARVRVMAKVSGQEDPVEFMLDTDMHLFNACPDAETTKDLLAVVRQRS